MRPEAAAAGADRPAGDHRARDERRDGVDEARVVSRDEERRLAAVGDAEQGDPARVDLRPPLEPLERGAEVLERDVLQPVGKPRSVEVPDDECRKAVRGEPLAEPGRSGSALLAADREHGRLVPRAGGRVQRPHEAVGGNRLPHRRDRPAPPAPDEGRGRDRLRRGDRGQDEPPRRGSPGVVGERRRRSARSSRSPVPSARRPSRRSPSAARRGRGRARPCSSAPKAARDTNTTPLASVERSSSHTPWSRRSPSNRMLTGWSSTDTAGVTWRCGARCEPPPHPAVDDGEQEAGDQNRAHRAPFSSARCPHRPVHSIPGYWMS